MFPEITGAEVFTLTDNDTGCDDPQLLSAVTEIVPLIGPATVFIEFEPEVPDQPDGSVQV
jgi:hypothetical protein